MPSCVVIPHRARQLAIVLGLTAQAVTQAAAAEEPSAVTPSAELLVDASPACASRTQLVERVHARAPRVTFLQAGAQVTVSARFSPTPAGSVAGDVSFAQVGAKPSVRHVLAQTCDDAIDAVALMIAVTLDPTSVSRAEDTSQSSADGAAGAAPTRASSGKEPRAAPEEPPKPARAADGHDDDGPPGTERRSRQVAASFGLHAALQGYVGPAPKVLLGPALYAMIGIERASVWSPSAVLGATHVVRDGVTDVAGRASFELDAASFDACPLRFRWARGQVLPCGSVLIGRFSAQATDTENPAGESVRPFWIVGGGVVATANVLWLIELSARVTLGANLVRDSFEFRPRIFHSVPALSGGASLGAGVRWH